MSNYTTNQYNDNDKNTPWFKIMSLIPEKARVLDIGCSSGNLGATLRAEKGCEVIGLDLDAEDVKKAAKRLSAAYIRNAEYDDLSDLGTFDCVIFADVIEHLKDPVSTLEKIKKLLNKSGAVIFSIPNMAHMGTRLMLLEGRFVYGETGLLDKTHLHYYDREEVQRVFNDSGFEIQHFDWVERYLPEKVVAHQLENMGLTPSNKFFKKNREVESVAYEFVGRSVPSSNKPKKSQLPFSSPNVDVVEKQIENAVAIQKIHFARERAVLDKEIDELLHQEARFISSLSWRVTAPLRLINGYVWYARQKTRVFIHGVKRDPRSRPSKYGEVKEAQTQYAINTKTLGAISRDKNVKSAIIIHLYYTDAWPLLKKKISKLDDDLAFDLFVTLPAPNKEFTKTIAKDYPNAYILEVPNRGRDVLPFLEVARGIREKGYEYLLKLHSKKSVHREDGNEWFNDILDALLPANSYVAGSLAKALKSKNTGVVGPAGQYVSLRVNYDSNSFFLFKVIREVFNADKATEIGQKRADYGFFAGTMFWARFDALKDVLDEDLSVMAFEHEDKQIDGTIAHGLERAFCVVPEVNGKDMYEIGSEKVQLLEYSTENIPEWSDLYVKPKQG